MPRPAATRQTAVGLAVVVTAAGLIALCRSPAVDLSDSSLSPSRRSLEVGAISRGELLPNLLADNDPEVRAAACELIQAPGDFGRVPALLRRAIDEDATVRSAATAALARLLTSGGGAAHDAGPASVLAWLDRWAEAAPAGVSPSACEVFADLRYVRLPDALAQHCLTCHAGRRPVPPAASDACRACHGATHEQWAASAHAQSLSHLHLPTTGGSATPPATISFGDLRGIGCTECHELSRLARPQSEAAGSTAVSTPDVCPYEFARVDRSAACSRCHADTVRQWRHWRNRPHPRRVDWPPGHVEMNARGDARSCVDCHMPAVSRTGGHAAPEHRWPARRDVTLLRQGLDVRLLLPELQAAGQADDDTATLVLTNLAGHDYPTGTGRRAVRLEAGSSSTSPLPVLGILTAGLPGEPAAPNHQPPLAPGEQRRLTIPLPPGTESVSYRLVYIRDLSDPESPTTEVLTGERRRNLWAPSESSGQGIMDRSG